MKNSGQEIKILIADDHPLFRQGLKHTFFETPDITGVDEVKNGYELLKTYRALEENIYHLVVLDISMPGMYGLDLLKQLRSENPKLPILILSVHSEDAYAVRFIKAGAAGYLTKESPPELIVEAVRKVARGGKFATPKVIEKLAFDSVDTGKQDHETLSDREYQVFIMIASGISLTDIGKNLSLSVKTISTHRAHIMEKMKCKKNAELIHYAINHKLL